MEVKVVHMTYDEKLTEIANRFGIDDEHFAALLKTGPNRMRRILDGKTPLIKKDLENIKLVFNIKPRYILNPRKKLPKLTMKERIDLKSYKTIVAAYFDYMKKYYGSEPWENYLLLKNYFPNEIDSFLDKFRGVHFDTTRPFVPNYMAVDGEKRVLLNIEGDYMILTDLPDVAYEKRFQLGKFHYRRANKVNLYPDKEHIIRYY